MFICLDSISELINFVVGSIVAPVEFYTVLNPTLNPIRFWSLEPS